MRTLIVILLAGLLAACAQSRQAGGRAEVLAVAANNTVDLASADGVMFLQSAHTGFMEAPPSRVVQEAPPERRSGGLFGLFGSRNGGNGSGRGGPEMREGAAVSPVVAHVPAETRGPRGGIPQITVRPLPSRDGPRAPTAAGLRDAFASAYDNNPSVNQARAEVRAADEEIAVARSGNRPTVTARVSSGLRYERDVNAPVGGGLSGNPSDTSTPTTLSLELNQPLFQGFRTRNSTLRAEANVRAERERLRAVRQDVLLDTALAFLDVRRFRETVDLREREEDFLQEQVASARSRLEFGEATRTDVDQALARLEEVRATLLDARANLGTSEARFRQLTGRDAGRVDIDIDVSRLVPQSLAVALRHAQNASPDIQRAIHEADEALYSVKTLEGEALPTVSLAGRVQTDIDVNEADRNESAEVRLNLEIPIYQGGRVSAQVRQAKEELGSSRIAVDLSRDQVRSAIASAWSQYEAAREAIAVAERSIAAARRALDGVLEELRVGQRTTIDVLNAQRDLIVAQITRLAAIRQRDGAAFQLLRAMGELDVDTLNLPVEVYDPSEHYEAVKDRWAGMRTPDGR